MSSRQRSDPGRGGRADRATEGRSATGYASISLKGIENLTSAVEYAGLRERMLEASAG